MVRNWGLKSGRKYTYLGGCHYLRGPAACTNNLVVAMEDADRAILATLEEDILRPDVARQAIRKALSHLRSAEESIAAKRKALKSKLARLATELAILTAGIANGRELRSLLAAIREREGERDRIRKELDSLGQPSPVSAFDPRKTEIELRKRLADWQGLLHRQPQQSGQILRKLLTGKLVFTPKTSKDGQYYEFKGQGTLGEIIAGIVCTKGVVSPDFLWALSRVGQRCSLHYLVATSRCSLACSPRHAAGRTARGGRPIASTA